MLHPHKEDEAGNISIETINSFEQSYLGASKLLFGKAFEWKRSSQAVEFSQTIYCGFIMEALITSHVSQHLQMQP